MYSGILLSHLGCDSSTTVVHRDVYRVYPLASISLKSHDLDRGTWLALTTPIHQVCSTWMASHRSVFSPPPRHESQLHPLHAALSLSTHLPPARHHCMAGEFRLVWYEYNPLTTAIYATSRCSSEGAGAPLSLRCRSGTHIGSACTVLLRRWSRGTGAQLNSSTRALDSKFPSSPWGDKVTEVEETRSWGRMEPNIAFAFSLAIIHGRYLHLLFVEFQA